MLTNDLSAAASSSGGGGGGGGTSIRILTISSGAHQVTINTPNELWPVAEHIKEAFAEHLANVNEQPPIIILSPIELAAKLMAFCSSIDSNSQDHFSFILELFTQFQSQYCQGNDVHVAVRNLTNSIAAKAQVLRSFYSTLEYLKKRRPSIALALMSKKSSALLSAVLKQHTTSTAACTSSLFFIFGGQGNVDNYFDELKSLYQIYYPLVKPLLHHIAQTLLTLSKSEQARSLNAHSIDIMSWLERESSRPSLDVMLDTDISMPLIAAIQLLNVWIVCRNLDVEPGFLHKVIKGTTGHSQGIVSSVVLAASTTERDFFENTQRALGLLFWLGLRSRNVFPVTSLSPNILQDSLSNNEGLPTPMLAISGLPYKDVVKQVEDTNSHLPESSRIQISLVNGPRAVVCSGPPQSLYGLNVSLRKIKAGTSEDQSRIPFSQRRIKFTSRFLPITVPFHSPHLNQVAVQLEKQIAEFSLDSLKLHLPVYETSRGEDLTGCKDLTMNLIKQITSLPVNWVAATKISASHYVDFGPGGASGIGGLTFKNKEGTGIQFLLASSLDTGSLDLLDKSFLFDNSPQSVKYAANWAVEYRPKLVRIAGSDKVHVDTRFSRLLGKPHLMVAGMTPCTVDERFVSAVINAGYHVELAGGGQHTEAHLRSRVSKIMEMVAPGEGITLNVLFLNPRLWGFQYPATMAMRKEGIPMEGLCIAAGVPSLDVADEVLKNLKQAGIKHVAFKPGSLETIRRVITIAKNNPEMPVILQWTGGRGGGHHSFEDMHQPLLETYGSIRRVPNISLVVGSGFGDAEETLKYLTGSWSTEFDYAPMPVDGILFGSRVMVAKEALTSQTVKELIVATPGLTDEADWEKTYKGQAGGIITVKSELGEPIHKIANRGMKLWKEVDDIIFSLPKEKRVKELLAKKDYLIQRLNQDFQKVWFGMKSSTGKPCDLIEMTYKEVAERLFELLYIKKEGVWIDATHRNIFGDFLRRLEERFIGTDSSSSGMKNHEQSLLQAYEDLDDSPEDFLSAFIECFPGATVQTLTQEDVFHFLSICSMPVRKPVPFIPVFDDKFEFWFKKDSLWQADRLEAVIDEDAQRVAILQGPVAVRHSNIVNEPVGEIMGNIYSGHISAIKKLYYKDSLENVPVVQYLGVTSSVKSAISSRLKGVSTTHLKGLAEESSVMHELSRKESELPALDDYLEFIAGGKPNWLRALLCSDSIVRDNLLVINPIKSVLRPRVSQTVMITGKHEEPLVLTVHDQSSAQSQIPSRHAAVVISFDSDKITVEMHEKCSGSSSGFASLKFFFRYERRQGYNPIHEITEGRNQRIKQFYASLWNIELSEISSLSPYDVFRSQWTVSASQVKNFVHIIGNNADAYLRGGEKGTIEAPMDFAIVSGWKPLVMALLLKEIDGDLLRLVHLSNEFRILNEGSGIYPNDVLNVEAVLDAVTIIDIGKIVEVKEIISAAGTSATRIQIISRFLLRGKFTDYENCFRRKTEDPVELVLKSAKDISVLKSKKWIEWKESFCPESSLQPGCTIIFRLKTMNHFENASVMLKLKTTGSIFLKTTKEVIEIGRIDYQSGDRCHGNVILEYLKRSGKKIEQSIFFEGGGYSVLPDEKIYPASVVSPPNNRNYSLASGDLNPIHTNSYFADLAGLPGTITHGMWTSASTRKFVEIFAANNQPRRVKSYSVTFTDMVLPGDNLSSKLSHIGMTNGRRLIKVETFNQKGAKVLEGLAEVEQQSTAYVFTGQGSQEVGMGMALYKSSLVSKNIWDRADAHMLNEYGVSLIEIVTFNPPAKTVHFGGKRGAAIRANYMSMTYDIIQDGRLKSLPLFPDISSETTSYTFSHPSGLLSATQFTQPALTLMEIAQFQDMKANGLVQENCPFAGHSLGEYAALAAVGEVLTIESLVDVVFYRGMTMQVAVPRDESGRSDYGMCAANPLRVGSTFGERGLVFVVGAIARYTSGLIEIVNLNVENFQYVIAGELKNLDILRLTLNKINSMNLNFVELMKTKTVDEIEKVLMEIVEEASEQTATRLSKTGGRLVQQERGISTIPLAGIDVPFHSTFLLNGVVPFREVLRKKLEARFINVELLVGKYIPNLTAAPFDVSQEYVKLVYEQTNSEMLGIILKGWSGNQKAYSTPAGKQELGYVLLIELLAHQFASPVRWAETQDQLFSVYEIERLVELGPAPILCGMATRTLKIKYEKHDDAVTQHRVQFCTSKDLKDIYYKFEDVVTAVGVEDEGMDVGPAPPIDSVAPAGATAVVAPAGLAAAPIFDDAPSALEIILVMISNKLKKPLDDITPSKTIKDLVNGKSTLQNEILGDLAGEFGNNLVQEKAEEMPLGELGASMSGSFSGTLGKVTQSLINKLVSSKMPGGYTMPKIKSYLNSSFGLGPKRSESVMLHGLTLEPAARFAEDSQAKDWLKSTAHSYASKTGISFSPVGSGSSSGSAPGGGGATAVINSEEFETFKFKFSKLILNQLGEFAKYLDVDLQEDSKQLASQKLTAEYLQTQLDLWLEEHGEFYADGIKPLFDTKKVRVYDSYWNWVRQDALQLYYDLIFGRISSINRELVNKCNHLINRTDDYESMSEFMEYYLKHWPNKDDDKYASIRELTTVLSESVRNAIDQDPVYINVMYQPTAPKTSIAEDGSLKYDEFNRSSKNMKEYVEELRAGSELTLRHEVQFSEKLGELESLLNGLSAESFSAAANNVNSKEQLDAVFASLRSTLPAKGARMPFVFLKSRKGADLLHWDYDEDLTSTYLSILSQIASAGISFKGKNVLVTGAGRGSIGIELVQMLLSGGARVIVTTARFSRAGTEFYRQVYEKHGAKGSRLVVVPFNGCSAQDTKALINYIYDKDLKKGLGWDLDIVIPFAAFPQGGREIDGIDSKSELAFRLMLTNVFRLMGEIKLKKQLFGYDTRPASVLLPLSPNHGTFGGDGLYSESKIALETLMNRFVSENWGSYLTIIGAVIGWTRGTGLMSANNIVAEGIESLGARTFAQLETAFNILGLLHPKIIKMSQSEPVWADLNGGLQFVKDLNMIVYDLRKNLLETAEIKRAVVNESKLDASVINGPITKTTVTVNPRANMKFSFPVLKQQNLQHLKGMLDLDKVVVIAGFGEVGPWGSSRTRWEIESKGEFSLEGCIEMAWMMGFIRFHNGKLKSIPHYSGWIDSKTEEPVKDMDVKNLYEDKIIQHAGIRLIEPEIFNGYDPKKKFFLQEVVVVDDMPPMEVSREDAEAFKLQHGEKVTIEQKGEQWLAYIKKGATLHIPKALQFDRMVAGQIPTGWSAARYGVPEDIIKQVDPVTLYVLVSTVEALVSSGITDPYEFYQYVHVSEIGNTAGGGMGGMRAMQKMFKERMLEKQVQNDILQESFINTMPAWVNMLLISSSGPIKTPVGACATAAESVEIAVDTIVTGKAKVVICGGYDDFQEEGSYEFANMKATSSSTEEFAKGREPSEMCRPASDTRAGFMEAHGAGIHILMSADLAVKMGVPIRGIVACTNTATDKNGRSVPAPGQGIITTAREYNASKGGQFAKARLLDLNYRAKQLKKDREYIRSWIKEEYESLQIEIEEEHHHCHSALSEDYVKERYAFIEKEAIRKEKAALSVWSHDFWKKDPTIAPIRGALATFGLDVNDIGVASFHGTGTKANDYNESSAVNQQLQHLGRVQGNVLPCIFQKHLTGHPKGAAAAWMLNGVLQVLESGIIPGNRNCDNVEARLENFKFLLYPSKSIQTDGIKAALLKSFGFGQAGGEVLVIHPDYLYAALEENDFKSYLDRRTTRQVSSYRYFHEMFTGKSPFVKVKSAAPYADSQQSKVYLNPLARATYDSRSGSWNFNAGAVDTSAVDASVEATNLAKSVLAAAAASASHEKSSSSNVGQPADQRGIGLDVQMIADINDENEHFIDRNFTTEEIEYCRKQGSPRSSFAGRWAAKEAVIKALSSFSSSSSLWTGGAGAPLKEIEIVRLQGQAPVVKLHGDASKALSLSGAVQVKVTISHSGAYAVAMAFAS